MATFSYMFSLRTFQFSPYPINGSGQKIVTLYQEKQRRKCSRFCVVVVGDDSIFWKMLPGQVERRGGGARGDESPSRRAFATITPSRTAQACISIFESTPQMQDGCRTALRYLLLRLRVLTNLTNDLTTLRRRSFNISEEGRSSQIVSK